MLRKNPAKAAPNKAQTKEPDAPINVKTTVNAIVEPIE